MMSRKQMMDNWEKILRGAMPPNPDDKYEMEAFYLRQAMRQQKNPLEKLRARLNEEND